MVSLEVIDQHFKVISQDLKSNCALYGDVLCAYECNRAYMDADQIPLDVLTKFKSSSHYSGSEDISHHWRDLLKSQVDSDREFLRISERHNIGYRQQPREMCLIFFTSKALSLNRTGWNHFADLQRYLTARSKEYLLDHFLKKAQEFNETVYGIHVARMMIRASKVVQEIKTTLRKKDS